MMFEKRTPVIDIALGRAEQLKQSSDIRQCLLYQKMRILLLVGKISGLFQVDTDDKWTARYWTLRIYRIIVTLLMTINGARFVASFELGREQFGTQFLFKVCLFLWEIGVSINALICYAKSSSVCAFFRIYERHRKICFQDEEKQRAPILNTVKKISVTTTVIVLLVIIINLYINVSAPYTSPAYAIYMMIPPIKQGSLPHDTATIIYLSINTPMIFFLTPCFLFLFALYICISYVIWKEFCLFNSGLEESVSAEGDLTGSIERHRIRHNDICRLVDAADEVFSPYIANVLGTTVIIFCLAIYMAVYNDGSDSVVAGIIMYLFWNGTLLCLVTMLGGIVNNRAHAATSTLHRVNTEKMTSSEIQQVHLFTARVTGPSIGFSPLGMCVIDMPTILTVIGTLLTYVIVMVQLGPSDSVRGTLSALKNATNATFVGSK